MAGNREGGLKAAKKMLKKDPNYYRKIGARGGYNGGKLVREQKNRVGQWPKKQESGDSSGSLST